MKKSLFFSSLLLATCTVHAQLPGYVPSSNLIAWYPFKGNANNLAATGSMDGTVNGAVLTTDRFGSYNCAYMLDGNTNNITIDTAFFDIGWSEYTISCWVNSDVLDNPYNFNTAQAVFNSIPHNGVALYFNWRHYNKYDMLAGSNPPSSGWDIMHHSRSYATCAVNVWKHLVMVKSEDTNYSLYVDGVHDTTYSTTTPALTQYCKLVLGRSDPSIISEGFYGKIDDYGIWNRALTECEIQGLFTTTVYKYITSHPANVSVAAGGSATFAVVDTGVGNTYQWQEDNGSGFINIISGAPYSGVYTNSLAIATTTAGMNGYKYRCIVNGAMCTDKSEYATLLVSGGTTALVNEAHQVHIAVTPNPTKGEIQISGLNSVDVEVCNIVGQVIKTSRNDNRISIADLPNGMYVLKLYTKGVMVYTTKIVKE